MDENNLPETILYELICCGEWREEHEENINQFRPEANSSDLLSYISPSKYFKKRHKLSSSESVKWLKSLGPTWQISLSPDGNTLVILETKVLETRSSKGNFSSTLGRSLVLNDPNFALRLIAWNSDSSLLGISYSNGQIVFYNTMAAELFSVRRCALPSQEDLPAATFSTENTLAGLFFATSRVKKHSHPNEIISLDSKGYIKSFRQTNPDQMTFHHEASIRRYYPKGVYSAAYIETHGIILVAGALEMNSKDPEQKAGHGFGITIWRILNDEPYYKITLSVSNDQFEMNSRQNWRFAVSSIFPDSSKIEDAIFKIAIAPNQMHIAALHTSGCITVWHVPSLKLHRKWPLKKQYQHSAENSRFNNRWRTAFNRWHNEAVDDWRFNPQDLNWWNDAILIISRVNGCVSLCSINEDHPSKNFLGDSPELFESPVFTTPRKGKGFLTLECEYRLRVEERRDSNGDVVETPEIASLELLDAYDSQFLPKTIIQEVLFWMTDIERFRPPRKRKRKPPIWKETHRLFLLRNITPQELFLQKIEMEEYGDALDLARAYKLDPDLVYQRQWSKQPVSIPTIRDYLGKIKKRNWVLQECLERIPENADAARELLDFGLKGTDISAAVMISQGKDNGMFHMLTPDDLNISHDEYLLLVDGDNFEVKRLLSYRKQFLYYTDMLDTYELIIGGPSLVDENFNGESYAKLRSRTPMESAVQMARSSDVAALKILLIYHWFEIAPQYLTVLSSFPETTCPHVYSEFLPKIINGSVVLWKDYTPKNQDWCERFLDNNICTTSASVAGTDNLIVNDITIWYEQRVHEIEKLSGITSYALDLARLGAQRNIPEIGRLVKDLEVVEIMVYDAKVDVSLEKLEELSPIDRLKILMLNTDEKSFIFHIRDYVIPLLEKCESQEKGARFHLLDQYLTSISEQSLSKPLLVFQSCKPGSADSIISDVNELMQISANCINSCKNPKQLDNAIAILNCLPERHRGIISDYQKVLHNAIDELDLVVKGVKILHKYSIIISVQEINEIIQKSFCDDEIDPQIEDLFQKICDFPKFARPMYQVMDWKNLLYDCVNLQKKVFKQYPIERCFEIYVAGLLHSGSSDTISLARDFIDRSSAENDRPEKTSSNNFRSIIRRVSSAYSTSFALYLHLIPYEKSLEMVMNAATHYFDSASNYADPDIQLCKICLNLLQNPKELEISKMFDLIDAVTIINKDFNHNILPQTVRLFRDKSKLVKQTMENIPDGYKKIQKLLKLAFYLKLEDKTFDETESWIYDMCGNSALAECDLKFCVQLCEKIIAKGYQTGWRVFTQTAKYQSDPPILDYETRLIFFNYALHMCPDEEILNVLNSKMEIK